jgi:hypothetical protein
MKRCPEAELIDIVASRKKINRENMKRHCMAESHDAAATPRSNNNTSKKRKRQGWQHNVNMTPPPRRLPKGRPRQKIDSGAAVAMMTTLQQWQSIDADY